MHVTSLEGRSTQPFKRAISDQDEKKKKNKAAGQTVQKNQKPRKRGPVLLAEKYKTEFLPRTGTEKEMQTLLFCTIKSSSLARIPVCFQKVWRSE